MIYDGCWLPDLFPCEDWADWEKYERDLYEIFLDDFVRSRPLYMNKPVQIRRHPMSEGREEAFWHVTCKDYLEDGEREPDPRRCERIRWVRSFIENSGCNKDSCPECEGVLVWSTTYSKTKSPRYKILLEEERYVVIVEARKDYCLLITAYYIEQDHRLRKMIREYEKETKTGSAPKGTQPGTLSTHGR